jgi:aminoglycoside 6-adenylyltransferase
MRTEDEIRGLLLHFAEADPRIRAVLLNGSRVNRKITPDSLQDYDIIFVVTELASFTADHEWINVFGEKIIVQMPDSMCFGERGPGFSYLMLFADYNRIDLTLLPVTSIDTGFRFESLTQVWLDKDSRFLLLPPPSDADLLVRRPNGKLFLDTCNEFWWVSTYVVKALLRKDVIDAKKIMETAVRPMFMKMIEWQVAAENNFEIAGGKLLRLKISNQLYESILLTYVGPGLDENWRSILHMAQLFEKTASNLAATLEYTIDTGEQQRVLKYLWDRYHSRNK